MDLGKRTPLFLASKYGNVKWVKILLGILDPIYINIANNANPTLKTFRNMTAYHAAESHRIKSYLQKAHQVSV